DPGFTREGGWMYTVYFGVWPQALATSLAWLSLGELARALGWPATATLVDGDPPAAPDPRQAGRATLWAALCAGAALLAHPIALPTLGLGAVVFAITLIPRAPTPWRSALARCIVAGCIAGLLALWWWLPMLRHQAWMASYGWLHASLEAMTRWATEGGALAQRMPPAVGYLALIGLALAAVGAGRVARFVALFALVQWLMAADDVFWLLRLDRLSQGFTHIQYQRFLIGAKPGLALCAGLAVAAPAAWARRLFLRREQNRATSWKFLGIAAALPPAFACAAASLWLGCVVLVLVALLARLRAMLVIPIVGLALGVASLFVVLGVASG
ncbi:MAG: hypothetical protein KC457_34360, partial [Myxococcales bacterium]|nr:hypothetical protein [Myxococcales bacterium]